MIDQQLINMLDDPDPKIRADAVKKLARTQTQEAVQYLAAVYKTDDDEAVRELARKAGLYIKSKIVEDEWTGGEDAEEEDVAPAPTRAQVSPRAIEAAKGLMDSAMNLHVAGDDTKALQYVEKAFRTNPNLQYESYHLQLAATIMNVPADQVVPILLGNQDMMEDEKPKRKRKEKVSSGEDEVTTEAVVIDLLIYWIVMAAILIIGTLIQFQLLNSLFDVAMNSPELTAQLSAAEAEQAEAEIALMINMFMGAGVVTGIIYSVISSLFSVIMLLIQYAFLHFSATSILSGEGTFKGLIHKLTNFFTASYAVYAIVSYIFIYLFIQNLLASSTPEDVVNSTGSLLNILSIVYFFGTLGWLYWLSNLIGKNYKFGTGKGCVSVIISSVLMIALACGCAFTLSAVVGNMVSSMMMNGNF